MSKHHSHDKDKHDHSHHGGHQNPARKKIHHDWRFWVSLLALGLMLLSMVVYVLTMDESLIPGGGTQPEVPAAAE